MEPCLRTIVYPVGDPDGAKALFRALLGVEPHVEGTNWTGFRTADGQGAEVEIGLDPHGHDAGLTGPVPYWHVEDLRATLAAVLAAGAEVVQDVRDVGAGKLVATVRDPDGNPVGLVQDRPGEGPAVV
ncbi:VOC family protein [Streptomyces sp. NPDC002734]|uniref:VOC family protein n=1 Tax=Streptomyces sp. NPDC002734 TaxID=3154426 RepID=UPI00331FD3AB